MPQEQQDARKNRDRSAAQGRSDRALKGLSRRAACLEAFAFLASGVVARTI